MAITGATGPWGLSKENWFVAKKDTAGTASGTLKVVPDGTFANTVGPTKLITADGTGSNRIVFATGADAFSQSDNSDDFQPAGESSSVSIPGIPTNENFSLTVAHKPTDPVHILLADTNGNGWEIGDEVYVGVIGPWSHSSTAPAATDSVTGISVKCKIASRTVGTALSDTRAQLVIGFAPQEAPKIFNATAS